MAKPDTKYLKAIDVLRAEILGGKYSSAHPSREATIGWKNSDE